MSTDTPQAAENDYEELKCKYCVKVIGWGKCICDQWAQGLVEIIYAQCYIRKIVNQPK